MPEPGKYHVVMKFGSGITSGEQSTAMMLLEQWLIANTAKPIEVFKEVMADDSKLRSSMTEAQRALL